MLSQQLIQRLVSAGVDNSRAVQPHMCRGLFDYILLYNQLKQITVQSLLIPFITTGLHIMLVFFLFY